MAPLQKLPKNVQDLGKVIVAKGSKKLPKVQKIAKSGHTDGAHNGPLHLVQTRQITLQNVLTKIVQPEYPFENPFMSPLYALLNLMPVKAWKLMEARTTKSYGQISLSILHRVVRILIFF